MNTREYLGAAYDVVRKFLFSARKKLNVIDANITVPDLRGLIMAYLLHAETELICAGEKWDRRSDFNIVIKPAYGSYGAARTFTVEVSTNHKHRAGFHNIVNKAMQDLITSEPAINSIGAQ